LCGDRLRELSEIHLAHSVQSEPFGQLT
jgi:hypothetical protein